MLAVKLFCGFFFCVVSAVPAQHSVETAFELAGLWISHRHVHNYSEFPFMGTLVNHRAHSCLPIRTSEAYCNQSRESACNSPCTRMSQGLPKEHHRQYKCGHVDRAFRYPLELRSLLHYNQCKVSGGIGLIALKTNLAVSHRDADARGFYNTVIVGTG